MTKEKLEAEAKEIAKKLDEVGGERDALLERWKVLATKANTEFGISFAQIASWRGITERAVRKMIG